MIAVFPTGDAVADDCAIACTMDYTPVCGQYGNKTRTFGNKCGLEVHSCTEKQGMILCDPEKHILVINITITEFLLFAF